MGQEGTEKKGVRPKMKTRSPLVESFTVDETLGKRSEFSLTL